MLNPAEEAALQDNTIAKTDDMTEVVPLGDIKYDRENQDIEPCSPPEPEAEPNKGHAPRKNDEEKLQSDVETKDDARTKKSSYESLLSTIESVKSQLDDLKSRLNGVLWTPVSSTAMTDTAGNKDRNGQGDHSVSVGKRNSTNKIIACLCCHYSDQSRVYGSGTFIPRLASPSTQHPHHAAAGPSSNLEWEERFDKAVSELAQVAASYKNGPIAPSTTTSSPAHY